MVIIMDPSTRLDYALFQLTPTRTRCDLVIFSGSINEKLASGLLDPFVSHLKFAKDEILKGGYSITLRPPNGSSWFTKAIFQRFVRFVSTPEVLERFVSIEREIVQIESSIQSNELACKTEAEQIDEGKALVACGNARKSTDASKLKEENEGTDDAKQEEKSKIQLQRLLKTRKVLLLKEQAMAYARSLAAGFEPNSIDDLISFSDSFGALRLREACFNFKELCKKKHDDRVWMDELAAIKPLSPLEFSYVGTTGIVIASENSISGQSITRQASLDSTHDANSPSSDQMPSTPATVQMPMPWTNQIPQYMYNFQSPGPVPQMSPSGGYPYPIPPYYPGNMQWHPNMGTPNHGHHKPSSGNRDKSSNGKDSENYEENTQTESSDSNSGSNSDSYSKRDKKNSSKKKHKKKSSRQVVIRNINYITSKRRDGQESGPSDDSSSIENEIIDGYALKEQVEEAVGSLRNNKTKRGGKNNGSATDKIKGDAAQVTDESKGGNNNDSWNALQNLLMRSEESSSDGLDEEHHNGDHDQHITIKSSENVASFSNSNAIDMESEKFATRKIIASDSFVVAGRHRENESRTYSGDFENEEIFRPSIKKVNYVGEEMLISQRSEDLKRHLQDIVSDPTAVFKSRKEEDWFVVNHSEDRTKTVDHKLFDENNISSAVPNNYTERKRELVDDSFMIHSQSVDDKSRYDYQFRADISMVFDLPQENISTDTQDPQEKSGHYEPDDMYMLPERDIGMASTGTSWMPEMDYGIEKSVSESQKRASAVEPKENTPVKVSPNTKIIANKKKEVAKKVPVKEAKPKVLPHNYLGRTKQPLSTSRVITQKSKFEKEEETRKKMEELLIQRQKRIAERSAAQSSLVKKTSLKTNGAVRV